MGVVFKKQTMYTQVKSWQTFPWKNTYKHSEWTMRKLFFSHCKTLMYTLLDSLKRLRSRCKHHRSPQKTFHFVKGKKHKKSMDFERRQWWRNKRCDLAVCGWVRSQILTPFPWSSFCVIYTFQKKTSMRKYEAYLQHIVSSCKQVCFMLKIL